MRMIALNFFNRLHTRQSKTYVRHNHQQGNLKKNIKIPIMDLIYFCPKCI